GESYAHPAPPHKKNARGAGGEEGGAARRSTANPGFENEGPEKPPCRPEDDGDPGRGAPALPEIRRAPFGVTVELFEIRVHRAAGEVNKGRGERRRRGGDGNERVSPPPQVTGRGR